MAAAPPPAGDGSTRWVHVFEEDTAEGAVYRPEGAHLPLSRRPREQLVLGADGRATLFATGPDDRLVGRPAKWRDRGDARAADSGGADVQVVERSPERLVVRIG